MEISAEKTKLMTNSTNGIQGETKVKEQKLCSVLSIKYLGAVVLGNASKPVILSGAALATTVALTKLKAIWRTYNISLGLKVTLIVSFIICIFMYAFELWNFTVEKQTLA